MATRVMVRPTRNSKRNRLHLLAYAVHNGWSYPVGGSVLHQDARQHTLAARTRITVLVTL